MRAIWVLFLGVAVGFMPRYTIENWVDSTPASASPPGGKLDSVEYQMLLPPGVFHGEDGRDNDLAEFRAFLQAQTGDKPKITTNIRQVTLFNISLMDPSQDQEEEETEWELKLRTTIDGSKDEVGLSDLTVKRGAVPDYFDWYPDHMSARDAGAFEAENKFELDVQCAERDYTQATKFSFPRGVLPVITTYEDLQNYYPKLFQTHEVAERLAKTENWLKARLPVGEINFEWNADIDVKVSGVSVGFVLGLRFKDLESAREGEEGWVIRPPELNWRVKRTMLPSEPAKRAMFLAAMETLFNAFLNSKWNGHEDCGQWNGVKTCAPGFSLDDDGDECVANGCEKAVAAVTRIPRGASEAPAIPVLPAVPQLSGSQGSLVFSSSSSSLTKSSSSLSSSSLPSSSLPSSSLSSSTLSASLPKSSSSASSFPSFSSASSSFSSSGSSSSLPSFSGSFSFGGVASSPTMRRIDTRPSDSNSFTNTRPSDSNSFTNPSNRARDSQFVASAPTPASAQATFSQSATPKFSFASPASTSSSATTAMPPTSSRTVFVTEQVVSWPATTSSSTSRSG